MKNFRLYNDLKLSKEEKGRYFGWKSLGKTWIFLGVILPILIFLGLIFTIILMSAF